LRYQTNETDRQTDREDIRLSVCLSVCLSVFPVFAANYWIIIGGGSQFSLRKKESSNSRLEIPNERDRERERERHTSVCLSVCLSVFPVFAANYWIIIGGGSQFSLRKKATSNSRLEIPNERDRERDRDIRLSVCLSVSLFFCLSVCLSFTGMR
jgi:hypothetical protein